MGRSSSATTRRPEFTTESNPNSDGARARHTSRNGSAIRADATCAFSERLRIFARWHEEPLRKRNPQ
jgi:hypothetical protein